MLFKNKIILLVFLLTMVVNGQDYSISVGKVLPGEVNFKGFELYQDAEINIEGECASYDDWERYLQYYGWILNSSTRDVVWRSTNCSDYTKEGGEYRVREKIKLNAGVYEIYFASASNSDRMFSNGFGAIHTIFNSHKPNIRKFKKKYFVKVSAKEGVIGEREATEIVDSLNEKNVISIIRVGDSESIREKFSLSDNTEVSIYGVGEGIRNEFYDFGFIYDVVKNKRVWTFNRADGKRAGGGKKNIVEHSTILLPKGSYYAEYKTDDSHSFDEWNVRPPDDPQYWGMIISLVNENDRKNIIPFRNEDVIKPVVEITKVEEDEFISKGFRLSKEIELRVLAVGEGHSDLVDFGWIENADTKETVWKMSPDNSVHAGGARKNRMADEIIELPKGNYILHYMTDDSHNYDDWNDTPPFEEDRWGITVWTTKKSDLKYVKRFNADRYTSKLIIASITKVGDDENITESFTLKRKRKVKIIAIGESNGNDLVDYAWITDKYGNVIWQMNYDETIHAGGALKNRLFKGIVVLDAGKYKLHYQTDGSHSFEEWNNTPPENIPMYGVTLLKVK